MLPAPCGCSQGRRNTRVRHANSRLFLKFHPLIDLGEFTMKEVTWDDVVNPKYDANHGRNIWFELQGQRLEVKVVKETRPDTPPGGSGRIAGFSQGARFRCLKFVSSIDWKNAGECWFVTLTYPDRVDWHEYETRQSHLSNFQTYLRRHYEKPIGFLWRIEWRVRQSGKCVGLIAPHFHLLVFGAPMLTKANVWNWWMQSIGERLYADVDVEELYNQTRVGLYIAKYASKEDTLLGYAANLGNDISGGSWGKRYKGSIPRFPVIRWRTTLNEKVEAVMREARGYAECERLGYNDSFTVLGPVAEELGAYCRRYTVDGELPNV